MQVFFTDGSASEKVAVEYPLGHRRRRAEGLPLLKEKFSANVRARFSAKPMQELLALWSDQQSVETMTVQDFMGRWIP